MRRTMLSAFAIITACSGPSPERGGGLERMIEQPRADAWESSSVFEDRAAMRRPPAGTLPYDTAAPVAAPPRLTRADLERGKDRYENFCAVCHGHDGWAATPVAAMMTLRPPPPLHEARIRAASAARLFDVITSGYALMPSYAAELEVMDRWRVVAYVRALQLAQRVSVDRLTAEERSRLGRDTASGGTP